MRTFEKRTQIQATAEELYAWHMEDGAFDRLVPPWQKVEVVERPETLEDGARLVMKVYNGPIGITWVAHHRDFVPGRQFVDEQLRGPFSHWVHTHRFEPREDGTCDLVDHVEYAVPLEPVGRLVAKLTVDPMIDRMFEHRHRVTRDAFGS